MGKKSFKWLAKTSLMVNGWIALSELTVEIAETCA